MTEPQRLALHKAARKTLGDEEGDTLMALTPPSNTDIATRQDIDIAFERLRGEILTRLDAAQWRIIGATIVLHGGTVGLLTLTLR